MTKEPGFGPHSKALCSGNSGIVDFGNVSNFCLFFFRERNHSRTYSKEHPALAGNRTRASRVAGENSTTEPPMQLLVGSEAFFTKKEHLLVVR